MENFIALSASSKKALHIAKISAPLPVNILVSGDIGVGKKLLCKEIVKDISSFEALDLEHLLQEKKINLDEYSSIVLYNIDSLLNKKQFFEKLTNKKIIATSSPSYVDELNIFPIKIKIEPLSQRKDDLDELVKIYTKEANSIYSSNKTINDVKVDISRNGISLKESIYKSILLNSISKDEMMDILYNFFMQELSEDKKTYKELLEIFEIPLLKSTQKLYKSQVQMANNLEINRIT
ncbi:MAG: hypothetical protein JXQ66_06445, partial [Campylobacterales bacterium]|nr:hypothetical protein [Campylobacterales bacterium]